MNWRVLLVGLDPSPSDLIESLLSSSSLTQSLEPVRCETPKVARERLRERPPAIVVCAETLDAEGGASFLSSVRERHPGSIRILYLDREDPDALIAAVNHAEIYRFLRRPLEPKAILKILESALVIARVAEAQEAVWVAAREQQRAIEQVFPHLGPMSSPHHDSFLFPRVPSTAHEGQGHRTDPSPDSVQKLSVREREIVEKLATGRRVKDIAGELFISTHTVRNHLKAIYRKLNVRSQLDLLSLMSREFPRK